MHQNRYHARSPTQFPKLKCATFWLSEIPLLQSSNITTTLKFEWVWLPLSLYIGWLKMLWSSINSVFFMLPWRGIVKLTVCAHTALLQLTMYSAMDYLKQSFDLICCLCNAKQIISSPCLPQLILYIWMSYSWMKFIS